MVFTRRSYNQENGIGSPSDKKRVSLPANMFSDHAGGTRDQRGSKRRRCVYSSDSESEDRVKREYMGNGLRRSSRRPKLVFETYNTRAIGDAVLNGCYRVPGISRKEKSTHESDEDMYTRVKRIHRGGNEGTSRMRGSSGKGEENDNENEAEEEEEEEPEEEEGDHEENGRRYPMRNRKQPPPFSNNDLRSEKRHRRRWSNGSYTSKKHSKRKGSAFRSSLERHRRLHHDSSTSSSSSSSSDDEEHFQRRRAKSLARSRNQFMPLNFTADDLKSGVIKDRSLAANAGASMADIDPMTIDSSVTFESVGGHESQIQALKEAVILPLMYPEVFVNMPIDPPRGLLFYGPPGTGKTLLARALANECSSGDRKVAFFMRKGADCLSKWVGESERQLRLLFDQAYKMRPSIIFFDEIDGLAPVRSSRQDQIHASIVSTLLGLIDGLDRRGEVVIIGATNRLDAIDPALRRPGRFDREFAFSLPEEHVRRRILGIQTEAWNPKPVERLLDQVAGRTQGFTGADLKGLVAEAALCALRRRYPQVYTTRDKLKLNLQEIRVTGSDFLCALSLITPTGQRSVVGAARPLPEPLHCLLETALSAMWTHLVRTFPPASGATARCTSLSTTLTFTDATVAEEDLDDSFLEETSDLGGEQFGPLQAALLTRPRFLLAGEASEHLLPALLHRMPKVEVFTVDLTNLYGMTAMTPEEALTQLFRDAHRAAPSVLYMPRLDRLLTHLSDSARHCLIGLLNQSTPPGAPVLILASAHAEISDDYTSMDVPPMWSEVGALFFNFSFTPSPSTSDQRRQLFRPVFVTWPSTPPPNLRAIRETLEQRRAERLPLAPPEPVKKLSAAEASLLFEEEERVLRELRIFLRSIMSRITSDRRFGVFMRPVDPEEAPDYYEIITQPMDIGQVREKINSHLYMTIEEFEKDMDLISSNALEYNPRSNPRSKEIRFRASELRDTTSQIIEASLNPSFATQCRDLVESRTRRGMTTRDRADVDNKAWALEMRRRECLNKSNLRTSRRLLGEQPLFSALPQTVPRARPISTSPPGSKGQVEEESAVTEMSSTTRLNSVERTPRGRRGAVSPLKVEVTSSQSWQQQHPQVTSLVNHVTSTRRSLDESPMTAPPRLTAASPTTSRRSCDVDAAAPLVLNQAFQVTELENCHSDPSSFGDSEVDFPKLRKSSPCRSNASKKTTASVGNRQPSRSNDLADPPITSQQEEEILRVDQSRLSTLLERCICGTKGWSHVRLEALYTALAQRVHVYKKLWDRRNLPQELEIVMQQYSVGKETTYSQNRKRRSDPIS